MNLLGWFSGASTESSQRTRVKLESFPRPEEHVVKMNRGTYAYARQHLMTDAVAARYSWHRENAVNEILTAAEHNAPSDLLIYTGETNVFPLNGEAIDQLRSLTKDITVRLIILGKKEKSGWGRELSHRSEAQMHSIPIQPRAHPHFIVTGNAYMNTADAPFTHDPVQPLPEIIPTRLVFNDEKGADILRRTFHKQVKRLLHPDEVFEQLQLQF